MPKLNTIAKSAYGNCFQSGWQHPHFVDRYVDVYKHCQRELIDSDYVKAVDFVLGVLSGGRIGSHIRVDRDQPSVAFLTSSRGCGKTTVIRKVLENSNPIVIPCRRLTMAPVADDGESGRHSIGEKVSEFLHSFSQGAAVELSQDEVSRELSNGQSAIIFDGLDELVTNRSELMTFCQWLVNARDDRHESAKPLRILFTIRDEFLTAVDHDPDPSVGKFCAATAITEAVAQWQGLSIKNFFFYRAILGYYDEFELANYLKFRGILEEEIPSDQDMLDYIKHPKTASIWCDRVLNERLSSVKIEPPNIATFNRYLQDKGPLEELSTRASAEGGTSFPFSRFRPNVIEIARRCVVQPDPVSAVLSIQELRDAIIDCTPEVDREQFHASGLPDRYVWFGWHKHPWLRRVDTGIKPIDVPRTHQLIAEYLFQSQPAGGLLFDEFDTIALPSATRIHLANLSKGKWHERTDKSYAVSGEYCQEEHRREIEDLLAFEWKAFGFHEERSNDFIEHLKKLKRPLLDFMTNPDIYDDVQSLVESIRTFINLSLESNLHPRYLAYNLESCSEFLFRNGHRYATDNELMNLRSLTQQSVERNLHRAAEKAQSSGEIQLLDSALMLGERAVAISKRNKFECVSVVADLTKDLIQELSAKDSNLQNRTILRRAMSQVEFEN